ncbi:Swt1 family HEPN domain-containing protein [Methanosarcina sp. 2.H.A.1B.4]|uniref:Swt1 family HEPN domain-containing protein n=1 Tax=Methanosarcina sp. 2.H.A.1B.4 TaxID=1483600 RepID=UPI0006228AD9|nr:Swt1 family HEPN domain-containing protein [Methanosarcina sp. 2.H.A.1B.4]KKG10445.1 hypothetical protein EO92_05515 [Methanosarcina sp. 2.H.A.1B.4]
MDQSETPNDNGTKRDKEDIDTKPVASKALVNVRVPKVFTPKLIESIQRIQSNYAGIQSSFAGVMANIQVPKTFDPELIESIQRIQSNYAGIQSFFAGVMANIQVPKTFDPELIESIQRIQSNYAGIQSSFAGVMTNVQVPKTFDLKLNNLIEDVSYLRNPAIEGTELLNVPAEDPRQIFPGSNLNIGKLGELEKLDDEISTAYKRSGFEFNNEAYRFLSDLETYLRYLIKKRIIEPHEKNLESKIPKDVLSRWEERKSRDASNEYDLIDYSDFTDLKIIFEKGRNKELFNDIFNNEECKALITKLHELDPIRKKIAHFRPLTKIEFTRLVLYHNDIFSIVTARQP